MSPEEILDEKQRVELKVKEDNSEPVSESVSDDAAEAVEVLPRCRILANATMRSKFLAKAEWERFTERGRSRTETLRRRVIRC